ncbi:MAG: AAA family ATPase [Patescibacteria group bacterium]|nr:AAA family ATPase [Patescibacteria group bacterium]
MEFYFNNSFLRFNPYLRKLLIILKEIFNMFIFTVAVFFLFSDSFRLKPVAFLIILIFLTTVLRNRTSKEDIRDLSVSKATRVNLNDYLTREARSFLINTLTNSEIIREINFESYFLKEILKRNSIRRIFHRLNISISNFEQDLKKLIFENKRIFEKNRYQPYLKILTSAFNLARDLNQASINDFFLFYGFRANMDPIFNRLFDKYLLNEEYLIGAIIMELFKEHTRIFKPSYQSVALFHHKRRERRLINRALTSALTPLLDQNSVDFTYLANRENAGFLIGHRKVVDSLLSNLSQGDNVLLVGPEGIGKETIVMHLAWLIQNELVSKELLDHRVVKLDLAGIYAQNKDRFISLFSDIINEAIVSSYIILYLPNLELILLEKQINIFQVLGEVLKTKSIKIIGSISQVGYEKSLVHYELDRFFEVIEVKEISREEALMLITLKGLLWEKKYRLSITPQAISVAINLASQFIKSKPLPASAEEIIIDSISVAKRLKTKVLEAQVVQEVAAEKAKIPIGQIGEIEKEKLLNLEELLHQRIVNQEMAVKELARVLKIYRAGLEKKKGPIGVFLFVGPTGVGKTETAKALAKIYYGSEKTMLRLDMVEFQNAEDIDKLVGTKDGTIIGRLTEPIRQNPYSLVLLDEFEKTHSSILRIFLPIFDEGLIKDALGREVDFTKTLIICTSNAYSEDIKRSIEKGEDFDKIVTSLKSKLTTIFSVELINRFDGVIVFKPLGENELLKIANLMIGDFKAEILLKHGIDLNVSEVALREIVRLGTDPIYGARPLLRKIDQIVKTEIANLILANKLKRGDRIDVDFSNNQFNFLVKQ